MPLFVVATPIGNLEDLSFRALRTLKEADLIAAEDTRRTSKLLAHYEIRRPVISLREHNEARETPRIISRLEKGEAIALVSDAGTPGISDPGARLVRAVRERGFQVVPIPGPSAISAALSASGFPGDEFVFMGFPPRSGEARQDWLTRLNEETRTVVFFESPHRIRRTLSDLQPDLVTRQIVVGRELTKVHEELVDSPNKEPKMAEVGEFTVVVGPAIESAQELDAIKAAAIGDMFCRLTNMAGLDEPTSITLTATALAVPSRAVAKIIKKNRILAKRQSAVLP
ncbi:MAG TPA: 16S rRNA (cytidine(1402)-2'-O)-methyltransferase [Vicinamibacterales bacterium]|nr:16S rRNA (cytidine(1402)-2'-O)-methyltransferase [Vicinamibacterales bacterium]